MTACITFQVRRAQLRKLLAEEFVQYEMELNTLGKAAFIQRT